MATTQKRLSFGTVTGTALTHVYTNGTDTVHPYLVITNTLGAPVEAQVYIETGSVNRILDGDKIAGGNGKRWRVLSVSDLRLGAGDKVYLQLPGGGTVNYFLSGITIAPE